MEITGKVIAVLEKRTGTSNSSGKEWATQSFVLETEEQHPKKCCIEIFGSDKIEKLMPKTGEVVTAQLDIDAKEYQGKWFNSIRAWKIEKKNTTENISAQANVQTELPKADSSSLFGEHKNFDGTNNNGDLPF